MGNPTPSEAFKYLLAEAGMDLGEEGLQGTPDRLVRLLREICPRKERRPPEAILTPLFEGETYDELVLVRKVRFSAFCEHHLLPFSGTASVGYIPRGKLVGISKLARLVQEYSTTWPTIQERLTIEVADAIERVLQPQGVMAILCAEHTCMTSRGVRSLDSETVTSAIRGIFKTDGDARSEFLRLAGF